MVRSRQNVDDYMSFQTRALDKQALATFVFKYRTKRRLVPVPDQWLYTQDAAGALQSLLIIERSPTPVPVDERPLDELSREELQDLVRRQRVSVLKIFARGCSIIDQKSGGTSDQETRKRRYQARAQ